jgi:hypothetical protein
MGAQTIYKTFPGDMTKSAIEAEFAGLSVASNRANGNDSYSGSWNTFIDVDVTLRDDAGRELILEADEAYAHIERHSEKWESAVAVWFKHRDDAGETSVRWLMGGWAAC